MQRINTPDGNWHAGDPSQGIKGTVVTQQYMQTVQEELAAVPLSVGMKLDPTDNKQILKAVQKIVGDASANYQPKLDYVPVQQGTGAGQGQNAVKIGWAKDGSGLRVTVDNNDLGLLAFASQLAAYASQDWVKGYAVNKAGDTMTGPLTLSSTSDWAPVILSAKDYAPRVQADNTSKSINFANGANNAVNMWVYDSGQVSTRGNLTVGGTTQAGGNNATIANDGNIWGPQWGGWLRAWLDGNLAHKSGDTFAGRVTLSANGWQADLGLHNWRQGQDACVYLRARDGGGLDIINSAYSAVPWQVSDVGETWQSNNLHVGSAILQTDGNMLLPFRNAWLSNILDDLYNRDNGKANAGARVQWDSGVNNFGAISTVNGPLPAPWVVCGLAGPGNGTANAVTVYGIVLRNQ